MNPVNTGPSLDHGHSSKTLIISNLINFALTGALGVAASVTDVIGASADTKASAKIEVARLQAAAEESSSRRDAIQKLLDSREASHQKTLSAVQSQYNTSLQLIAGACRP